MIVISLMHQTLHWTLYAVNRIKMNTFIVSLVLGRVNKVHLGAQAKPGYNLILT